MARVTFEVRQTSDSPATELAAATPRRHSGWLSVQYKGRRYQLFGGIRTPYWIVLSRPIVRKNPPPQEFVPDEGPAEHIRNALAILLGAQEVKGYHQDGCFERDDLIAIQRRLEKALAQVEDLRVYMGLPRKPNRRSVRRGSNPALAVLGNPRVEDATIATWAKIEYMRPDDPDGSDVVRVHEFKDGFEIGWLSDGSVQLRHPKHPLWMDDEED